MRTNGLIAFVMIAAVIAGAPAWAAGLSDAALTKVVADALTRYTVREKSVGLAGLKGDIDACYRQLGKNAGQDKIAYCIALDDITTRSNLVYGPGAAKLFPYFSTKPFDARVAVAIQNSVSPRDADAFRKRVLAAAEPAAAQAAAVQQAQFH
jgi:hypothetical protein